VPPRRKARRRRFSTRVLRDGLRVLVLLPAFCLSAAEGAHAAARRFPPFRTPLISFFTGVFPEAAHVATIFTSFRISSFSMISLLSCRFTPRCRWQFSASPCFRPLELPVPPSPMLRRFSFAATPFAMLMFCATLFIFTLFIGFAAGCEP
jgi:hypothetical protein